LCALPKLLSTDHAVPEGSTGSREGSFVGHRYRRRQLAASTNIIQTIEVSMKGLSDREIMFVGALLGVAVLMTPVAGIWIWLAVGLGLWGASIARGLTARYQ
jgi:hypothetical protein